jgi:predicted PurR-regulated permease PerM
VCIGLVFYALKGIVAPVLLAFLLAYAFAPLVEILEKRKVPRAGASILCLILVLIVFVGLVSLIFPALQQEIRQLAQKIPVYLAKIKESAIPWIENTFGVQLPQSFQETLEYSKQQWADRADEIAGPLTSIFSTVLSSTFSLLASLIYLVIIPLFTFYFLQDYGKITNWFKNLVPYRYRQKVGEILSEIDSVLSGFIRGQLIICSILAFVYSVILSILGIPAAITIGIVAGLFNLVPYLGTATGLLLSCLFLLLEGMPAIDYLYVGITFSVVAGLDGMFLTPKVLGKKLGLPPVAVILAIMAFSEVFGFLGVLMAVPVTAIVKVLGVHTLVAYRKSDHYTKKKDKDSASLDEPDYEED